MIGEVFRDPQKIIRRKEGSKLPKGTFFSRNLTVLRKLSGMTQREAARFIGVNEKSYQSWEYGYSSPSTHAAYIAICNAFQMFDLYAMISRDLNSEELGMAGDKEYNKGDKKF